MEDRQKEGKKDGTVNIQYQGPILKLALNNIPHSVIPPDNETGSKEGVVIEETNMEIPIEEVGVDACSSEMEVFKETPVGEM